ncbi:MAG: hypothetical protein M3Y06_11655 [Actinomycetota bacterium]|nr:hypothetical protein [Actinomycetota bacterium]
MHRSCARLLMVAHGTASPAGSATTAALIDAARARRRGTQVDLCFLDVASPRLVDALDERPTVVVPLLLSTGYHVQTDIPAVVASFAEVRVAAHLGPDPLVVDALVDRLAVLPGGARSTVLVAAGSSRPEAVEECRAAAGELQHRLSGHGPKHPVTVATMADDIEAVFAALPQPYQVATYLLAEGAFVDRLARAAHDSARVAAPLGVHPALVELVWKRYDDAQRTR